jgi:hypothetical protein
MFNLLFRLLIGHAFADFVFQTDAMAKGKNRHVKGSAPPGQKYVSCWLYWLSAHALVHGGVVIMLTGLTYFGVVETILHFFIDTLKCENVTSVHTDQFLHFICKITYILILYRIF